MIRLIETNDKKMSKSRGVHYEERTPATGHSVASRDDIRQTMYIYNYARLG